MYALCRHVVNYEDDDDDEAELFDYVPKNNKKIYLELKKFLLCELVLVS